MAQAPNRIDVHKLVEDSQSPGERIFGDVIPFAPGQLASRNATPISLDDLASQRGDNGKNFSGLHGYNAFSLPRFGMEGVQQMASKGGKWTPGQIAILATSVIPRGGSGDMGSGRVGEKFMAFHSDYMPGSLYLQKRAIELAEKHAYNPDEKVDGWYLIFKLDSNRPHPLDGIVEGHEDAPAWTLVDQIKSTDPNRSNSALDFVGVDRRTGEPRPIRGLLTEKADALGELRRTELGLEKYREQADVLIWAIGRHFNPQDEYDFETANDLSPADITRINAYINATKRDPYALAAPLTALAEYMRMEIHEFTEKQAGRSTTPEDHWRMEDRRDQLRDEVYQAQDVHLASITTQDVVDGETDGQRWRARLVTPADAQALMVLSSSPKSPCRKAAAMELQNVGGQVGMTQLMVYETAGNTLIKSTSYKPGQGGQPAGGSFVYAHGHPGTPYIPVHAEHGPFPIDIRFSTFDYGKKNMMPGIVGEVSYLGHGTAEEEPERYLIIDALAAPAKLMMGASRYYRNVRESRRRENAQRGRGATSGIRTGHSLAPTLHSLMFEDHEEPFIAITRLGKAGAALEKIIFNGQAVHIVRSADRRSTQLRTSGIAEDNTSRAAETPVNSNRKWGRRNVPEVLNSDVIRHFHVNPPELHEDEVAVASLAYFGTVWGKHEPGEASITVMRSHPGQFEDIQNRYDPPTQSNYGSRRSGRRQAITSGEPTVQSASKSKTTGQRQRWGKARS